MKYVTNYEKGLFVAAAMITTAIVIVQIVRYGV